MLILGLALAALLSGQDARSRLPVAVVEIIVDDARQGQIKHGRGLMRSLGADEPWGRFDFSPAATPVSRFEPCEDRHPDHGLNYCVRYYLSRQSPAEGPPSVAVIFADRPDKPRTRHPDEMRVLCYGRGVAPSDAAAQDIWLWPSSVRMHGMRDLDRDMDALDACIRAAAAEPPGIMQPGSD